MSTPLQGTNLMADQMISPVVADQHEEQVEEAEAHIHMPNPSLWPLITTIPIILFMVGILFINEMPWLCIIMAPLVLVGMMGWALENPFAPRDGAAAVASRERAEGFARTYSEANETGRITPLAAQTLAEAQDVADHTVTVSSTAYSAHPLKVEIEREGVVLALYGKVELEAQKKEVEDALLKMPGVIDVKNFLVAEDAILNAVNATIDRLKSSGKLEGSRDITALVENYIVSLYGYVPDPKMKTMLEKEIVGIPGVRVVINHIGLNEDIPGNLGRTRNK